jgi:acetyl-CoA C-acetyltransferase
LKFSGLGGPYDTRGGRFERGGSQPRQIYGELKRFGHPVGASGSRVAFEVCSRLPGRAIERRLGDVDLGLVRILGGARFIRAAAVSVFDRLN